MNGDDGDGDNEDGVVVNHDIQVGDEDGVVGDNEVDGVGDNDGAVVNHDIQVDDEDGLGVGKDGEVGRENGDGVDDDIGFGGVDGDDVGGGAAPSSPVDNFAVLSRFRGPLSWNSMPRAVVYTYQSCKRFRSFHPITRDILKMKNIRRAKIRRDYIHLPQCRRNTVVRNYRSGKMFAVRRDGTLTMSPEKEIQREVDAMNRIFEINMTMTEWNRYVKRAARKHYGWG